MNKKGRVASTLFRCAMAVSLLFSGVSVERVMAQQSNNVTAKEYKIYPIPRSVEYLNQDITVSNDVNVVYEDTIDQYTKSFLEEVVRNYGKSFKLSNAIKEGKTNIILGTKDGVGVVDEYFNNVTINDTTLFEQVDPYVLHAKDNVIAIMSSDTDGAFYGVATLQMMMTSFAKSEPLLAVHVEDYAGMEFRGVVEGFYGGWDYPARKSLMRLGRDVKMNNFVYASKTDKYHTDQWNVLYPENELNLIRDLVQVGNETKCYYTWSVHLGGAFKGAFANVTQDERYNALTAKFDQLYEVGVRKFDILNDDFGSGSHAQVVELLNRIATEYIPSKPDCKPLSYCMKGYNKAWSGNGAELTEMKKLDQSISLFWTGDDVNWPITQQTVDFVKDRTGHEAVFWLNYPVNEHGPSGVYLGDISHYARSGVTGLKGAVSNPSRFAQSNKVALFQLASLFWNNTDYENKVSTVWRDAFRYLEPEVEEAYFKIASNVSNCPNSGRISQGFKESEYIATAIDSVINKVNSNVALKDDAEAKSLIAEFEAIKAAVVEFRKTCDNQELKNELDPWLNSLVDIANGGIASIKCVIALQAGDVNVAWQEFSAAAKALETWDNYPTFNGSDKPALAGSKRIQPMVTKLTAWAKNNLTPLMDPNAQATATFYGKIAGNVKGDDAETAKVIDNDINTFGSWNQNQIKDDYVGVDLGRVVPVKDITIIQGNADNDHDWYHNAVLEYSSDENTWTPIETYANDSAPIKIEKNNLNFNARYVRLRLTKTGTTTTTPVKANYWTHMREFTVNKEVAQGDRVFTNVDAYKKQALTEIGRELSLRNLNNVTLNSNQYIGIKLNDYSAVTKISFDASSKNNLTMEYSVNGTDWIQKDALDAPTGMKFLRVINKTNSPVTFNLTKLALMYGSRDVTPTLHDTSFKANLKEGNWDNMFDGKINTYAWTNESQDLNDYIIIDLGALTSVYDVTVHVADGKPRLYSADLQVSTDKTTWNTIGSVVNDGLPVELPCRRLTGDAKGQDARYVRILITDDVKNKFENPFLKIHEIEINKNAPVNDVANKVTSNLTGELDKVVDGNISSVFTTTSKDAGWLEYLVTDNTNIDKLSILQDASSISNAVVKVKVGSGYVEVGRLDQAAKTIDVSAHESIAAIRVEWEASKVPSIYEIFTTKGANNSDDIGEYVPHIMEEPGPVAPVSTNLALRKPVEVSGSETANTKQNAVDGKQGSRWDSNYIKGNNRAENAWIYVDLGADKISSIDEIKISYFNKVYPTDYDIQIADTLSNPMVDGDWTTVKTITKDRNLKDQVDTEKFTTPITGRYVRLFFRELNPDARGNGVAVSEFEVNGTQSDKTQPVEPTETGITIAEPTKKEYNVGDSFDDTGLVVKVTLSDGTTKDLTKEQYTVSGFDSTTAGTKELTVTYGEFTTKFSITVKEVVTTEGITITNQPTKKEYVVGESLNLEGLKVQARFSDGTTKELENNEYTVIGYDKDKAGEQTITVKYDGKSATFKVTVVLPNPEVTAESITINTMPTKTVYVLGESLDLSGMKLVASMSNGDTKELTTNDYEVSGYNPTVLGKQVITLKYGELTTTFEVTVNKPDVTITGIKVTTKPNKLEYKVNEKLDLTGLVVTAKLSDNTTRVLETSEYTVSGYKPSKEGKQTILITCGKYVDSFNVNVVKEVEQVVSKSDLLANIDSAKKVNESEYTEDSYKVLKDALNKAIKVYDNKGATQKDVDAATKLLKDAIAGLKKVDVKPTDKPVANGNSGYDDGGPFTTDECGSVYDRWGNLMWKAPTCKAQPNDGYHIVNTGDR